MLKLIDYRAKSKGLPDLLPYAALIEPGVVLNKDGSLLAGWEVRGQDTASSRESDLASVSSRFNNAVKLLGSGWSATAPISAGPRSGAWRPSSASSSPASPLPATSSRPVR